jgi:AcrR family transcriptional regulator
MTRTSDEPVQTDESLEAQRRRQLMTAAMECVAEVGVVRTTMRMIADRAGVTTGMVLYYYRSKKELIAASIAAANEEFSARMNQITDGTFGPRRLEAILQAQLGDPAEGVPRNFSVQFRAASLSDSELRRTSLEEFRIAREKLRRSIWAGQEHGELRRDIDASLAADLLLVLMQGLAHEEVISQEVISRERALEIGLLALSFLSGKAGGRSPTTSPGAALRAEGVAADRQALAPAVSKGLTTPEALETLLREDTDLGPEVARQLSDAFAALYRIARKAT